MKLMVESLQIQDCLLSRAVSQLLARKVSFSPLSQANLLLSVSTPRLVAGTQEFLSGALILPLQQGLNSRGVPRLDVLAAAAPINW